MTRFTTLFTSKTFRVAGAVAVLAVTAPLAAPSGAAEDILEVPCKSNGTKLQTGPATWQRFNPPRFEPGVGLDATSQEVTSFAVSPGNTRVIAVTNGKSIRISKNGGCTFQNALRLDRLPDLDLGGLSALTTEIKSVFVTKRPGGGTTFLALAEELETGVNPGRPHVLRSTTGEQDSWRLADSGLPPLGKALALRAHRTRPDFLYLTFENARDNGDCPASPLPCDNQQAGRRLGLMYASTDNGQTWENRTNPADLNTTNPIKYVSVDDDDSTGDTVWVVSGGVLYKSTDGGRSFDPPDGLDQSDFEFTAVESLANEARSAGVQLVAFSANREMVRLDRGKWIRSMLRFNGGVGSVAQRPEGDIAVVTAPGDGDGPQVWRIYPNDFRDFEAGDDAVGVGGRKFRETFGWQSITPDTGGKPLEPAVAGGADGSVNGRTGQGTYYVREGRSLLRFLGANDRTDEDPAAGIELDAPLPPNGRISPSSLELDLEPGRTRTVDYTLTLPPSPTPLDVYLLVDNSGSMIPFINELKANLRDVARALNATGVDVGMGVGQINVQPDRQSLPVDDPRTEGVDESKVKPIYRRLHPISKIDGDLFTALAKLDGNSGSGQEPQLEALYQAVEGSGLETELSTVLGSAIKRDQDAEFRDELNPIKVIVHATDENFTGTPIKGGAEPSGRIEGGHNEPGPVAAALKAHGVKQIGLSMDQDDAHEDLTDMARRTGALAPRGGVDCDGDGVIGSDDVKPGDPMVCGQSIGLDRTLVNLLQSLSDRAEITLTRTKASSPAVARVSRESFGIDAKKATTVRFSVTFSCTGLLPGNAYQNVLTAALRGREIAKTVATVNCGGPPGSQPIRPPGVPPVNEPAANPPPVQPQPVLPAPVPVQPVPQPQTQVQAQTQVNPQAGMADQEEQQFQLAAAGNDITQDEEQLAMTGLSYDDAATRVLGVGIGMALCAGVALRRRSRTAAVKVRVNRF